MKTLTLDKLFGLEGKTALVTGGAKGVGAMISEALLSVGCRVIVVGRSGAEGEEFARAHASHGKCSFLAHDLSTIEGVRAAAAAVAAAAPALDILVNNAGAFSAGPLDAVGDEHWDREMGLNLRAPFFLVQSLLPQLRAAAREGEPARIVNIGSIAALWAKSSQAYAYGAAKAGIHQLTRMLASDLAASHITVNAIAPGFFPSDMTAGFFTAVPGLKDQVIASIPAKRLGTPEDIGGAVIFLCARAGAYLSGTVVPVEGGLLCA
jgi:NAD(P)-dependent dehydrogenase (short-subunit alcohol dehydrogenase family)